MHHNRTPEWRKVTPPSGWSWTLPFTIQKRGRKFRPDASFNIQTRAGITVAKPYYVKTDGSDAADGLSWSTAKKSLSTVLGLADVDRIHIAKGYYYRNISWSGVTPGRSVEVIGDLT